MRFQVNAETNAHKAKIMEAVEREFPNARWGADLNTMDKVLEVHGIPEDSETAAQVLKAIQETGFTGSWLPE